MKLPLVIFAMLALSGCGLLGKGKSSKDGPDESEPTTGTSVHFDAAALNALGEGRNAVWTYQFSVNGESRAKGENVALFQMVDDVSSQTFLLTSSLTFEITAIDAESKELLASNLPPDAMQKVDDQKKWAENCADVSPVFQYGDAVRLCDFAGIIVNPTFRLEPAQALQDPRWITWECVAANDDRLHDMNIVLYSTNYAVCTPGYTIAPRDSVATASPLNESDGTLRPLALPEDIASHSFEMKTVNTFVKFAPGAPANKRFSLQDTELDQKGALSLPVGKMEDCYALEVQLLYKDSGDAAQGLHKEARLTFRRSLGANDLTWVPDDQTRLPTPAQIYAGDQDHVRYWLHCRWNNAPGIELSPIAY